MPRVAQPPTPATPPTPSCVGATRNLPSPLRWYPLSTPYAATTRMGKKPNVMHASATETWGDARGGAGR
eukprot:6169856-Prymnesium_polylepis.1